MTKDAPSRLEVEAFVKSAVAALAHVNRAGLHETTVLRTVLGDRPTASRYLAMTLRGFVRQRGGGTITTADITAAITIGDLVRIIIDKWK